MAFWKESMINRLSNLINRNRSAAKISQVLCSSFNTLAYNVDWTAITIAKKNCQKSVLLKKGYKPSSCTELKLIGLSLELKTSKENLLAPQVL